MIAGGVSSCTVTLKQQVVVLPNASVARKQLVVVPTGNSAPEGRPDSCTTVTLPLLDVATSQPPSPPRLAFVRTPAWQHAEPETERAFAKLVAGLGERISEVGIGEGFDRAIEMHRIVMEVEMTHNLHRDFEQGGDALSAVLRALIERGRKRPAIDYAQALAGSAELNRALDGVFDGYDAILTPAAPGPAPHGLDSTGNPAFCSLWTFLGTPAVTLPLLPATTHLKSTLLKNREAFATGRGQLTQRRNVTTRMTRAGLDRYFQKLAETVTLSGVYGDAEKSEDSDVYFIDARIFKIFD